MNGPLHYNPKWWGASALFFGFLFFLMGFGGFLMERQNLFSDTIRYMEKAGSYTALKESIKEFNSEDAVPVWIHSSGIDLVFCYPAGRPKMVERQKTSWPGEYGNFSKILFYPIPGNLSWDSTLKRLSSVDPRSLFFGFHPVFKQFNKDVKILKYELYLWIPLRMMNSFQEEVIYTPLEENDFEIHRESVENGLFFKITWEEVQNAKGFNAVVDLPEPVTEILTRLNMIIFNGASLN